MRAVSYLIAALLAVASDTCGAFETQTHALITRAAYDRTVFATDGGKLSKTLGFDRLSDTRPFDIYWATDALPWYYTDGGVSGALANTNVPEQFERCQMQEFFDPSAPQDFASLFEGTVEHSYDEWGLLPLKNWLVRGAIREDDLGPTLTGRWAAYSSSCGKWWLDTVANQPHVRNDDPRSFHHFYDPQHDIGLTTTVLLSDIHGQRSVDWALGYWNSFDNPPQETTGENHNSYSYADARNEYWWALTRQPGREDGVPYTATASQKEAGSRDRLILWATLFRSLGNVVHLLQDAAQPQHTRNDPHSALNTEEQQAFEGYTNARVLGDTNPSSYVRRFFDDGSVPVPRLFLGTYGISQPVMFATPLHFFTTRVDLQGAATPLPLRAGMADYTNRGFFTGGTLPGMPTDYPEVFPLGNFYDPANNYTIYDSPECDTRLVNNPRLSGVACVRFLHEVPDLYNPDYALHNDILPDGYTAPNVPLATESIFRPMLQDLIAEGMGSDVDPGVPTAAVSDVELTAIGNLTIPRAVGYSAGLINFFFRGALDVKPPIDGVVAVLNHGTRHHVEDGYPIEDSSSLVFGFKKIRLRVGNSTPDIVENEAPAPIKQTMGGASGKLVAVARFHRNPCYTPDLTGEIAYTPGGNVMPNGCATPPFSDITELRTEYPEIAVSDEIPVPVGMFQDALLNDVEFIFANDPIPVNATDLFIQVVYRGPLGAETDGIAVGSYDVAEPTYGTFVNARSYFEYDSWGPDNWLPYGADPSTWFGINTVTFCVDQLPVFHFHEGDAPTVGVGLLENQFLRIAMLLDQNPHARSVFSTYGNRADFENAPPGVEPDDPVWTYQANANPTVNQDSLETAGTYSPPLRVMFAGMVAGDAPIHYQADYFTTVDTWIDGNGQPKKVVLHPGNPDDSLYFVSQPMPVPASGMYLPDTRGAEFSGDPDHYCMGVNP